MRVTGVGDRVGAREMLAEPLTHSWPFRLNRELAPCSPTFSCYLYSPGLEFGTLCLGT